jgi:ABC-type phosphate/phosphonate transport system permease subunit
MGTSRKRCTWVVCMVVCAFGVWEAKAQQYDWSIALSNGEKFQQVALTRLTPDSLIVTTRADLSEWFLLDSLVELRRERRSAILPAVLIGAAGGGAVGYALKPTAVNQGEANLYSIAFGLVVGGAAGFVIGSNLQSDEVIDMRGLGREAKVNLLRTYMP